MKKRKSILLSIFTFTMFLFALINTQYSANAASTNLVDPSNTKLHYEGRIDNTNPKAVRLLWEGSTIKTNFEGTSLKMQLENSSDNYLNVFIDGELTVLKCKNGDNLYTLAFGLEDKVHSVEVFKRTEASIGAVIFKGFILDDGKQLIQTEQANNLKIEFYGDSITAGACDEDPGDDQWSDHSTHNNYMSYGAITARELNAEYMCTAVSGIGVTHGYQTYTMPQLWDKIAYDPNSATWNYNSWQADYVVVNLGENDKSTGVVGDFTSEYVKLVKNIREKYPNASIFCVLGPMSAGQDETFINYVSSAVNTLNADGDNKVFFHKFSQYSGRHPRVETNIKVADELVKFIKDPTNTGTGDINATLSYTTQYDNGNQAGINVVIKNNSSTAINGWKLNFTFLGNQTISNMWNGTFTQKGKYVTITNASWNSEIPANGSVTFGTIIKYTGTNTIPINFTLNGLPVTVK